MGQLDTRSTDAGTRVLATAQSLKKIAGELQSDDLSRGAATLATAGADRLERIGDYLKESDGLRLVSDAERFGRARPWAVATTGFLLGLAGSRMLKASALSRHLSEAEGVSSVDGATNFGAPVTYADDTPGDAAGFTKKKASAGKAPNGKAKPTTGAADTESLHNADRETQ